MRNGDGRLYSACSETPSACWVHNQGNGILPRVRAPRTPELLKVWDTGCISKAPASVQGCVPHGPLQPSKAIVRRVQQRGFGECPAVRARRTPEATRAKKGCLACSRNLSTVYALLPRCIAAKASVPVPEKSDRTVVLGRPNLRRKKTEAFSVFCWGFSCSALRYLQQKITISVDTDDPLSHQSELA